MLLRRGQAKDLLVEREKLLIDWMDNARLLVEDKYGYDFDKIVHIVELVRPDFVFIDYIQMISTKGFRTKLDAIEEYVRKMKQLSVEYDFGAILVSQVNRSGIEGAEMQHLKWAGVLEEHADGVLMLKWDWSLEDQTKFIIDVKKQRHGPPKNGLEFQFIPEYSLFKEKEIEPIYQDR
jgi:replicative DNA helicase